MLSNLKSEKENKEYLKSVIGVVRRNQINWKNGIGKELKYEYIGYNECSKGVLKIRKYENNYIYFEGYEKGIYSSNLIKCALGGILNLIWHKAPWMIDLGVSVKDARIHTTGSGEEIYVKCPLCGKIKKIAPYTIYTTHSIGCSCGDGVSFNEKFVESALIQLEVKYMRQYRTDWSQNKIYDFYLLDTNTIIEVHGEQHYKEKRHFTGKTLKEEQENDKLKEELALKNGIKHYIVIDCSKSELEYIKNNILDSELNVVLKNKGVDLSKVNWIECEKYSCKNKVKEVCDYYKEHTIISIADLAKKFGISKSTIRNYLNQGTELGWCKYDGKETRRSGIRNSKSVSQFTLKGEFIKTYPSTMEAAKQTGIYQSGISACCNGKQKMAGGYMWRFTE